MGEIIPTSAALRITGSKAEVELVLEALAKAGFSCKCNEKFYPYQDKGKTKYSIYLWGAGVSHAGALRSSEQ